MYPRSEFPNDKLPEIVRKNGSVNKAAVKIRLCAVGCPNAKAEIAVAAIKAGHSITVALQIAMLAYYADDLMVDCIERTCNAIKANAERKHADKFPLGKCAEDIAARRERRPSRWGTPEYRANAKQL